MRRWLETLGQDIGYAMRSFRRSPAFVLVALLSLTLGIGATSAIFSVIYGVLIAPYPYARPGEIWAPEARALDGRGGHGYALEELRALSEVPAFADVMATSMETVLMTGEFAPESFGGVLLSGNAFNFLGVPPVVGRTIQPTDASAPASRSALSRMVCAAAASAPTEAVTSTPAAGTAWRIRRTAHRPYAVPRPWRRPWARCGWSRPPTSGRSRPAVRSPALRCRPTSPAGQVA